MENKKENLKRIAENRVSEILVLLSQLTNLSNSACYECTDEDIEKIFAAIEKETKKSKEMLLKGKNNKKRQKRFEL